MLQCQNAGDHLDRAAPTADIPKETLGSRDRHVTQRATNGLSFPRIILDGTRGMCVDVSHGGRTQFGRTKRLRD